MLATHAPVSEEVEEAIELEIKDINLESKWAVLNGSKTDGWRGVPLHRAITGATWASRGLTCPSSSFFLTQKGKPYTSHRDNEGKVQGGGYFKTARNKTLERAGLTGYTPYSMRHTFNNWLIMAGINQATREALMGHDNGSTNAMYSDVPQEDLIREVEKLKDFMLHGNST